MHTTLKSMAAVVTCLALICFAGCNKPAKDKDDKKGGKVDHHDHEHPTVGPHKGDLTQLGKDHEHWLEMVEDKDGKLTFYVLDEEGKKQVSAEDEELVVEIMVEDKPVHFKAKAKPMSGEKKGSSRFVTSDGALHEELEKEGTKGSVSVKVDGKSYKGTIEHHHEDEKKDDAKKDDAKGKKSPEPSGSAY